VQNSACGLEGIAHAAGTTVLLPLTVTASIDHGWTAPAEFFDFFYFFSFYHRLEAACLNIAKQIFRSKMETLAGIDISTRINSKLRSNGALIGSAGLMNVD
jgi:hypothetical protein